MSTTQHITIAIIVTILLVPQLLALYLTGPRGTKKTGEASR